MKLFVALAASLFCLAMAGSVLADGNNASGSRPAKIKGGRMFDYCIDKARNCAANNDFDCADGYLKKAEDRQESKKDRKKMKKAKEYIAAQRNARAEEKKLSQESASSSSTYRRSAPRPTVTSSYDSTDSVRNERTKNYNIDCGNGTTSNITFYYSEGLYRSLLDLSGVESLDEAVRKACRL